MDIILNLRILKRIQEGGELTVNAIARTLDEANYVVGEALKELYDNGLLEKNETTRTYVDPPSQWEQEKVLYSLTRKGNFALNSVNVGYFMIQRSLQGEFNLNNFKNKPEENSPEYIR